MLYYRINNKSYIERVIFVREPNTEEMTMSKFYAAVGGDLSDVLERLEDLDIVKFYLPEFENDPTYEGLMQSLKNGDLQSAFRAAHTLKGIGYNLGTGWETAQQPFVKYCILGASPHRNYCGS